VKLSKLLKNNSKLKEKVKNIVLDLSNNPFDISLKSHKVDAVVAQNVWSSSITGDVRIIWHFIQDENGMNQVQIIELLDIGGHSGGKRVYK
jgi:mRNA-degrading endonuclease YafQ of YafQ-DinJ toxin-antitoxin module